MTSHDTAASSNHAPVRKVRKACLLYTSTSGDADAGLSQRLLATLLTWMQDRDSGVFLAATSNDISALPPEMLRKGRFDEIFFVDLPGEEVRVALFALHLKKRGWDKAVSYTHLWISASALSAPSRARGDVISDLPADGFARRLAAVTFGVSASFRLIGLQLFAALAPKFVPIAVGHG